jgi:hypothetical protein
MTTPTAAYWSRPESARIQQIRRQISRAPLQPIVPSWQAKKEAK